MEVKGRNKYTRWISDKKGGQWNFTYSGTISGRDLLVAYPQESEGDNGRYTSASPTGQSSF